MSLSLTFSQAYCPVTKVIGTVVTCSGGTAWTPGTSPISITSGSGAAIDQQNVSGDGSSVWIAFNPRQVASGAFTLSDSVNSATGVINVGPPLAGSPFTGTRYYVRPSIQTPDAPTINQHSTAGVTSYSYQITANNANGSTAGIPLLTSNTLGHQTIATTTTGFATLGSTIYNVVTWKSVPGATSYTVWKWTGSAFGTVSVAQTGTSYLDKGGAITAATIPATNTTAVGSDSNNGTSWATAFATIAHALSVASGPNGDRVEVGAGRDYYSVSVQLNSGTATKIASVIGQGSALTSICFQEVSSQIGLQRGTNELFEGFTIQSNAYHSSAHDNLPMNDQGTTTQLNCVTRDVIINGYGDGIVFGSPSASYDLDRLTTTSIFDVCVVSLSNAVFNAQRSNFLPTGNATYSTVRAFELDGGVVNLRECNLVATGLINDTTCVGLHVASGAVANLYNCTISGDLFDIAVDDGGIVNLWGCSYNSGKVSLTGSGVVNVISSVPVDNPLTRFNGSAGNPNATSPDGVGLPLASNVLSSAPPFGPDGNGKTAGTAQSNSGQGVNGNTGLIGL